MLRFGLLVIVAVTACHRADRATLLGNTSRPAIGERAPVPRSPERTIADDPRVLAGELALVRSYEGLHDAASREGLEAAARVFDQIRWTGMSRSRVAALLGQPTEREPAVDPPTGRRRGLASRKPRSFADETWSYQFSHLDSSVFLKLRFDHDVVTRTIIGATEVRVVPFAR